MVRAIVIPHDAGKPVRIQELPDIGDFQETVDGWIEPKEIHQLEATLYVNASAYKRRLPFNSRASGSSPVVWCHSGCSLWWVEGQAVR